MPSTFLTSCLKLLNRSGITYLTVLRADNVRFRVLSAVSVAAYAGHDQPDITYLCLLGGFL